MNHDRCYSINQVCVRHPVPSTLTADFARWRNQEQEPPPPPPLLRSGLLALPGGEGPSAPPQTFIYHPNVSRLPRIASLFFRPDQIQPDYSP